MKNNDNNEGTGCAIIILIGIVILIIRGILIAVHKAANYFGNTFGKSPVPELNECILNTFFDNATSIIVVIIVCAVAASMMIIATLQFKSFKLKICLLFVDALVLLMPIFTAILVNYGIAKDRMSFTINIWLFFCSIAVLVWTYACGLRIAALQDQ